MPNKYLVVVAGPTAVGKTGLSVQLASYFKTDIISADSRQLFQEMSIGTAKPSVEEMDLIKHHFIDHISIKQDYNAGNFELEALKIIETSFREKDILFLCGGSGLYINAICDGFDDLPTANQTVREELKKLYEEKGLIALQQKLLNLDPEYHSKSDIQNPQRVIRAIEVSLTTGMPYSLLRKNKKKERAFNIIKIGLNMPRNELYERVNQRVDDMILQGLEAEARRLFPYKKNNALQTVGYKEMFDFIEGKTDLQTAIELIKKNTRNYAKRQLTWFSKDKSIQWFHPSETEQIIAFIKDHVK